MPKGSKTKAKARTAPFVPLHDARQQPQELNTLEDVASKVQSLSQCLT